MTDGSTQCSNDTDQKVLRRCTNCGDEFTAEKRSHTSGYDCMACGASARNIETVRELDTGTEQ